MTVTATSKGTARPLASVVLRYGLAFASIAAAMGLARLFLYFHLPQPFAAFALSAIAITFWYGGNMPGIVAALLASIIRYTHWSETQAVSRVIYDLVFLIFAFLMMAINRTRSDLEVRVAERTADLTRANEELSLKIAEHKRAEEKLRESEAYLAEAQKVSGTGSWDGFLPPAKCGTGQKNAFGCWVLIRTIDRHVLKHSCSESIRVIKPR